MVELVYPPVVAQVLGKVSSASEMFPVVDANGFVIAQAARSVCHGAVKLEKPVTLGGDMRIVPGDKLLHPVVHLHIIDRQSRLYIQRRSALKRLYPRRWDTAVGGHVTYGEFVMEALFREAGEELGFYEFNPVFVTSYIHESFREKELVNCFAAVGSYELKPDAVEVEDGRYWTLDEIEDNLGKEVFTPNFEQEYSMIKDKLLALL